ncbi:hypothetical protein ACF05L_21295 [Streptomyces bobili]|uniref:hypothetical protein n=1 Tax=Streptomyces bobili TaxID=67280 RepID=UPI0036F932BF
MLRRCSFLVTAVNGRRRHARPARYRRHPARRHDHLRLRAEDFVSRSMPPCHHVQDEDEDEDEGKDEDRVQSIENVR